MREHGRKIFLDSGAYTMFTQGTEVDLKAYGKFIRDNQDVIEVASNLDDVTKNPDKTLANQQALEDMGAKVCPVYHIGDDDGMIFRNQGAGKEKKLGPGDHFEYLQGYIDNYDYLFLGGLVPETTKELRAWLDLVWSKYLTKPDGSAKIKVHGFGLTTTSLMTRYPWYSVDSTSWVMTGSFGGCYLDMVDPDDGLRKEFKVDFSSQSGRVREDNSWHFSTMLPAMQERIRARVAEIEATRRAAPGWNAEVDEKNRIAMGMSEPGLTPESLAASYGWRDYVNVDYFRRIMADRELVTFTDRALPVWEQG
jgi:hypothetical protein